MRRAAAQTGGQQNQSQRVPPVRRRATSAAEGQAAAPPADTGAVPITGAGTEMGDKSSSPAPSPLGGAHPPPAKLTEPHDVCGRAETQHSSLHK